MNFLAIRYLLSKKKQTILTLLGITLGTAGYIAISGIMLGFQTFLLDQFINSDCHIRIKARDELVTEELVKNSLFPENNLIHWLTPPSGRRGEDNIDNIPAWSKRLSEDSRVEAFALQLQYPVLTQFAKVTLPTQIIGINPDDQLRVSRIEPYMTKGSFLDLNKGGNQVIVGEDFLTKIGARIGDSIVVSIGNKGFQPFKVIGTFRFGMKKNDEGIIYARLVDVQTLARTPSKVSDIVVRLVDSDLSLPYSLELSSQSKEFIQSWEQANESTLSVFKTQDIVRYSMTIAILIVAGFGIFNVLSMTVTQKRKEIAILRSMGYEPNDITGIFIFQGTILGFIGGVIGIIIGFIICKMLSYIEVNPARAIGMGRMLINFSPQIYLIGFSTAFLSSLFSSYIPARAAGKMEPMDIMRSES
ncbi:MAG: ABC transporter permease [Bacteriovoracaceae bacterium]